MNTQTRNRGASRANSPRQGIPGGTFAAGLVTGVIITLAFSAIIPNRSPATVEPEVAAPTPASGSSSNFQFYTLLNELEVVVPDASAALASETEETVYWLQAASFRNLEDADRQRASLLLLNLDAKTSQVNAQGTLWHRVMVGPYSSRTQMESARRKLVEAGLQPLLLQEKQPRSVTR